LSDPALDLLDGEDFETFIGMLTKRSALQVFIMPIPASRRRTTEIIDFLAENKDLPIGESGELFPV